MRFNNNLFMSKALRKAIMHRSKLKKHNKYRTENIWANYKKQRKLCVNLLRKTKTEYFQKLNVKAENFEKPSNHFSVTKV